MTLFRADMGREAYLPALGRRTVSLLQTCHDLQITVVAREDALRHTADTKISNRTLIVGICTYRVFAAPLFGW